MLIPILFSIVFPQGLKEATFFEVAKAISKPELPLAISYVLSPFN